jgi:protein-disulfide isomerase
LSAAIDRRALILGALSVAAGTPTLASPEPQRVPIELVEEALELEAAIRVGNRQGDVTLVEFFDYNCPWCRRSAADLPALLGAEPELAYVLVNFAVLGAPSVQATKVALGFFSLYGPERYLALHRRLFALRGAIDGTRALKEASELGASSRSLHAAADSRKIVDWMTEALRVGNSLGVAATPSFVIGPEAYQGHLSLEHKRALIAKARA